MPADMSNSNNNNAAACPNPLRHCHIGRSADFSGYGFNLHTIKGKVGQFIGQVDDGSPAEVALLRRGDRIIEVNGVNIAAENHKQVVSRIKLVEDETTLLVVDEEGDAWYKDHKMVLSAALPGVVKGTSVVNRSRRESSSSSEGRKSLTEDGKAEDRRSLSSATSSAASSDASNRQDSNEKPPSVVDDDEAPAHVVEKSNLEPVLIEETDKLDATVENVESVVENGNHEIVETALVENGNHETVETAKSESIVISGDVQEDDKDRDESALAEKVINELKVSVEKKSDSSSDDSEDEQDEEHNKTVVENLKNDNDVDVFAGNCVPPPSVAAVNDVESVSSKSSSGSVHRNDSVSSTSSRGSAALSNVTHPVADKSPMSTSPTPPSSVGAPSPTPTRTIEENNKNTTKTKTIYPTTDGLNMNMSVSEMRALLASRKKKDIRHSEMDLKKKYEIVQKL